MSAYVIVEVAYHDPSKKAEYQSLTPASIAAFGGRFIVRGGATTVLEGDWNPERIVVIEFPSAEVANDWWNSDLYGKAKAIRQGAAYTKMIIVAGV